MCVGLNSVALFERLGGVEHKSHNETAFRIGGERHLVRTTHGKDLTTTEVMAFRHMLTRAGWAPQNSASKVGVATSTDLLVVLDHNEARLYQLDVRSTDRVDHVIKPHDPHRLLHHVSHNDQAHGQRQRLPEDHAFFDSIAQAISPAGAVVVIGHGVGRSNAAHQLIEFLHQHHAVTAQKVVCEVVSDLSSLTAPQLLDLGRRALTAELPSSIERPIS